MKITIVTLFPQVFSPILNSSILKRAQDKSLVEFKLINLRDCGEGSHQTVDDRPYGGGAGMVLKAAVLAKAVIKAKGKSVKGNDKKTFTSNPLTLLTSASGRAFTQKKARDLAKLDHIILICGHYEGV